MRRKHWWSWVDKEGMRSAFVELPRPLQDKELEVTDVDDGVGLDVVVDRQMVDSQAVVQFVVVLYQWPSVASDMAPFGDFVVVQADRMIVVVDDVDRESVV